MHRARHPHGPAPAGISPDVIKKLLPHFKGLDRLELGGKKVTAAVLAVAAKQPWAQNIRSYTSVSSLGADSMDLLPLLGQATKLETLKTGGNGHFLRSLANEWREKRGGDASPLLTSLDVSGSDYYSLNPHTGWQTFVDLPTLFPELERLSTNLSKHFTETWPMAAQPFARLRVLTIPRLARFFGSEHWTTKELGAGLRGIFAACPNLQELSITHGQMYLSGRDRKDGKRMDPLPGVDGALAALPSSLTSLRLADMALVPSDFELVSLPSLNYLSLARCGSSATATAESVLSGGGCPRLARASVFAGDQLKCLCPKAHAEMEEREKKEEAEAKRLKARVAVATATGEAGPSGVRPESSLSGSHDEKMEEEEAGGEDAEMSDEY